jgi:murein L,D-transpeptidase YcbB/YkuD
MRRNSVSVVALMALAAIPGLAGPGFVGSAAAQDVNLVSATPTGVPSPPVVTDAAAVTVPVDTSSPTYTREEPKPAPVPLSPAPAAPSAASIDVPAPASIELGTPPTIETPPAPSTATVAALSLKEEIAARLKAERPREMLRADRDAAKTVYDARQGAPIWVTEQGFTPAAFVVMTEILAADSYGLDPKAFRLPTAPAPGSTLSKADLADLDVTLSLAALEYARYARGGRLDPVSLSKMLDRKPTIFEPSSVLTELAAAAKPDAYLRNLHPKHPQFERLRLKYVALRSGQSILPPAPVEATPPADAAPQKGAKTAPARKPAAPPTPAQLERKLLANMEMWRWMPLDLGADHIANNIPEFTTRLIRGGRVVWSERIITGKPETPTSLFSDEMRHIVFRPFWNVPESIKWKELQPQLQRSGGALARAGLRATYNGREINPGSIDWSATDLRNFHVFQPPGPGNALGQVKFVFPNKHDIYMHDTPTKPLFNTPVRAYSHGCVRVRDPLTFAEMILGPDKGMTRAQINALANSGPDNNEIKLTRRLPVHITYFTTVVDDDGTLKLFSDIYNIEQKVHLGLEGKAHLIQQPRIIAEKAPPRRNGLVQRPSGAFDQAGNAKSSGGPVDNWIKQVFSF